MSSVFWFFVPLIMVIVSLPYLIFAIFATIKFKNKKLWIIITYIFIGVFFALGPLFLSYWPDVISEMFFGLFFALLLGVISVSLIIMPFLMLIIYSIFLVSYLLIKKDRKKIQEVQNEQ